MQSDFRNFSMQTIEEAARLIKEGSEKRKALAEKIVRSLKDASLGESKEGLVIPVESIKLNSTIAGIDSGFMSESMLNVEIVFVRAIAAIFSYENGKLSKASYWPELAPYPEAIITTRAMQNEDVSTHRSLQRLLKEVKLAIDVIERFKPNYCLLDGSIIPQHADKPRNNSKVKPLYRDVIGAFENLFEISHKNNCTLVACVEDSRGTRLKEILSEHANELKEMECYDISLLNYILSKGERTFAFSYAKDINEHPILKDFDKKFSSSIYAFYLRASNYDVPLRVEFLSLSKKLSEKSQRDS